jgi:hypothetical protein
MATNLRAGCLTDMKTIKSFFCLAAFSITLATFAPSRAAETNHGGF